MSLNYHIFNDNIIKNNFVSLPKIIRRKKSMLYTQFKKGINIGGWLSQYDCIIQKPLTEEKLRQHFDTFIKEDDIRQISA